MTAEDAELLKVLTGQGPVTMHLTLTPQTLPDAQSYNVIADWKGTEHPEQVVVVSGHLDSWDLGTGAIDDGAGVAVSMQAIQLMKELGIHPRRTVRVIAWMSEEEGSEGAAAYMKEHAAEMGNHVGAIESDLGADHPTGIYYAGKAGAGAVVASGGAGAGCERGRIAGECARDGRGHCRNDGEGCAEFCAGAGQPVLFQLSPHGGGYLRQDRQETPE